MQRHASPFGRPPVFAALAASVAQDACDCAIRLPAANALPWGASRPAVVAPPAPARRRRLWDLGETLHCSIIGTCLSTDELRRLLRKLNLGGVDATDHSLHGIAVTAAARQDVAGKLLNKTLDERHRATIRRFEAAEDREALRAAWRAAMDGGDIAGGYWAVLTHPLADQSVVRDAFSDVHMLSHLVGAANRADIRRLTEQTAEIARLRETVARQQARLHADITERDARIRALQDLVSRPVAAQDEAPEADELARLIADLRGRLDREASRREACERRMTEAEAALRQERTAREGAETALAAMAHELALAEMALEVEDAKAPSLRGTVLYVGGRSGQTALLRDAAARCGAELWHHDAEQGSALLPGLVGRADLVVFPVDCVSHEAALAVKRLCRQADRPFRPLRSAGVGSLLAALSA